MAGLVPAIHVLSVPPKDVDARDKRGHDEMQCSAATQIAKLSCVAEWNSSSGARRREESP
jgi:hypothetical protein